MAEKHNLFERLCERSDIWMIIGAVETVKRFPKGEVANHIHGEPVEPVCQVGRPVTFVLNAGADLAEEGVDIGLYERFLLAQCFLRESMV